MKHKLPEHRPDNLNGPDRSDKDHAAAIANLKPEHATTRIRNTDSQNTVTNKIIRCIEYSSKLVGKKGACFVFDNVCADIMLDLGVC